MTAATEEISDPMLASCATSAAAAAAAAGAARAGAGPRADAARAGLRKEREGGVRRRPSPPRRRAAPRRPIAAPRALADARAAAAFDRAANARGAGAGGRRQTPGGRVEPGWPRTRRPPGQGAASRLAPPRVSSACPGHRGRRRRRPKRRCQPPHPRLFSHRWARAGRAPASAGRAVAAVDTRAKAMVRGEGGGSRVLSCSAGARPLLPRPPAAQRAGPPLRARSPPPPCRAGWRTTTKRPLPAPCAPSRWMPRSSSSHCAPTAASSCACFATNGSARRRQRKEGERPSAQTAGLGTTPSEWRALRSTLRGEREGVVGRGGLEAGAGRGAGGRGGGVDLARRARGQGGGRAPVGACAPTCAVLGGARVAPGARWRPPPPRRLPPSLTASPKPGASSPPPPSGGRRPPSCASAKTWR